MTRERNQSQSRSEARLSSALRELAESSSQGASAELGSTLKDAYRRHHRRRRRMLQIRLSIVCLCVAGLAFWLLPRRSPSPSPPKAEQAVVPAITTGEPVSSPAAQDAKPVARAAKTMLRASPRRTTHRNSSSAPEAFVALPASAMLPPDDELRIVRLEMPGEDLRLVGAPVAERVLRQRVTADFVVGHDGTPYAVRLVTSRY